MASPMPDGRLAAAVAVLLRPVRRALVRRAVLLGCGAASLVRQAAAAAPFVPAPPVVALVAVAMVPAVVSGGEAPDGAGVSVPGARRSARAVPVMVSVARRAVLGRGGVVAGSGAAQARVLVVCAAVWRSAGMYGARRGGLRETRGGPVPLMPAAMAVRLGAVGVWRVRRGGCGPGSVWPLRSLRPSVCSLRC